MGWVYPTADGKYRYNVRGDAASGYTVVEQVYTAQGRWVVATRAQLDAMMEAAAARAPAQPAQRDAGAISFVMTPQGRPKGRYGHRAGQQGASTIDVSTR